MKYGNKEIHYLWDSELLNAYKDCKLAEEKRQQASQHEKFKKMEFAPINPAFVELKTEIENEIRKRKLMDI